MMFNGRSFSRLSHLGCGLILLPASRIRAQQTAIQHCRPAAAQIRAQDEPDPLKRQRSDKDEFKPQKELRQEFKGAYKTWLDQDVAYIITDEERKAFKNLRNDEEREAFIEQFWLRRNPNPDSPDNEFREEHYRRIAVRQRALCRRQARMEDRPRPIYIAFGKPGFIESHPSGGSYQRPMDEGGGETSTFPFETWHYRYLEGIGDNIDLEFVDTCQCGDYHFTIDRGEKDALMQRCRARA